MSTMNLSLIIKTIDRATAPIRKIRAAISSLANNPGLRAMTRYANAGGRALGYAASKARDLVKWATAAAGAGIVALGFNVFRVGAQFERFQAILENTEGSTVGARRAMAWVTRFAERTPYQLADVMDAFVKLRAYGIDPTNGVLETLGDTAAGMGKTMMEAVEALADAQNGEFERLKEFNIRASSVGSAVRLSFDRDGKQMVVDVRKNAADIREALMGIWAGKFGGQMEKQSKGLAGLISNIADIWNGFMKRIGDAGVFDYAKSQVAGILDLLKSGPGIAKANKLAKGISDGMIKAIKTLKDVVAKVDFGKLIADIASLIAFGAGVISFLGGLSGAFNLLASAGIAKLGFDIGALAVGVGAIFGIAAAPIAAIVAVVTGLAVAAFLVWRNWDWLSAKFGELWDTIATKFRAGVAAVWKAMPDWMRGLLTRVGKGVAFTFKLLSGGYAYEAADRIRADRIRAGRGRAAPPAVPPMPRLGPPRGSGAGGVGMPKFERQSWSGHRPEVSGVITVRAEAGTRVVSAVSSSGVDFDRMIDRGLNLGFA